MLLLRVHAILVVTCCALAYLENSNSVSNGQLKGSNNRWNYNEVHRRKSIDARIQERQRQRVVNRQNNEQQSQKNEENLRFKSNLPSTPAPTPETRVQLDAKYDVGWAYDTLSYYLKASSDMRFKIRHAPIPAYGSPWPMPKTYLPMRTTFRVLPGGLQFRMVGGESCDILEWNFKRIHLNMFETVGDFEDDNFKPDVVPNEKLSRRPVLRWFNVTILKECTEFPYLEMNESYDLEVKPTGVSIIALEVWGALRGMETFSQLVYENEFGQFLVNKTFIRDEPRFKHRGVLIDTSRHYIDKETLIANLEAMAQNKMNVFHWHIVDDQSFPYESKVYPNLTRLGAYNAKTHIYTHKDIAEIIEEARLRGIRVVPEFDTPGHTFSWGFGQDHLLTPCYDYNNRPNGLFGPINPILRKTYTFLQNLFAEILTVFKDKYVHLGGDEVPFDCWYMNPALKNFRRRNNLTDARDLLNIYERKLFDIVTKLGRKRDVGGGYIVWQEVFDNGVKVKPDTIIQVWSGDSYNIERVTKAGLRALFSSCWYLDYINYGLDWDKYYNCDQINMSPNDYQVGNESLLLGGEVCLWTEFADDDSIMPRIWPRASAAAERLWSDRNVNNAHEAAARIEAHRCRMMRTGLKVGVLSGPGHCARSRHRRKRNASGVGSESSRLKGVLNSDSRLSAKVGSLPGAMPYWGSMLAVVLLLGFAVLLTRHHSTASILSRLRSVIQRLVGGRPLPRLVTVFAILTISWILLTVPIWGHGWFA